MFVLLPDGYEVLGAGIATCLSNCIACLYFLGVLVRMGKGSVVTFSLRAGRAGRDSIRECSPWECPPLLPPSCLIWIM